MHPCSIHVVNNCVSMKQWQILLYYCPSGSPGPRVLTNLYSHGKNLCFQCIEYILKTFSDNFYLKNNDYSCWRMHRCLGYYCQSHLHEDCVFNTYSLTIKSTKALSRYSMSVTWSRSSHGCLTINISPFQSVTPNTLSNKMFFHIGNSSSKRWIRSI